MMIHHLKKTKNQIIVSTNKDNRKQKNTSTAKTGDEANVFCEPNRISSTYPTKACSLLPILSKGIIIVAFNNLPFTCSSSPIISTNLPFTYNSMTSFLFLNSNSTHGLTGNS